MTKNKTEDWEKEKLLEKNKHISSDEIKQDIIDTEIEIKQMSKEMDFLAVTPMGMKETSWNHMRANARKLGIKEGQEFIENLKAILEARGEIS